MILRTTYIWHQNIDQMLVERVVGILDVVVNAGELEEAVPSIWVHFLESLSREKGKRQGGSQLGAICARWQCWSRIKSWIILIK